MALRAGYKGIKKKYADAINSGQGGSGGGNFERTEIYTAQERQSTAELSGSINDYDYIELLLYNSATNDIQISPAVLIPVSSLSEVPYVSDSNANPHILVLMWAGIGFSLGYDSNANTLKMWGFNNTVYLKKVYGIKF